jgi:hypothetical protein
MVLVSQAPDLAAIPMLAYLVRDLVAAGLAPKIKTRTALYDAFVDQVFAREQRQTFQRKSGKVRGALQALAFYSLAADPPQLGYADYEVFENHNQGRVRETDLLGFGLVNSLVERGPGEKARLFFTHQSFQEFLAAQYAWAKPEAKNQVIGQMWQPRWREVLKFLVGMDRRGEVLQAIYPGPEADNLIHSRLFLAAACLPEDRRGDTDFSRQVLDRLAALAEGPPFDGPAVAALVRLDSEAGRQRLAGLLGQKKLRENILKGIAALPPPLPAGLASLLAPHLEDKHEYVRWAAARTLGQIGERLPPEIISALARRLEDDSDWVRSESAAALGQLGERLPPEIIHALARRLEDGDNRVRLAVAEALKNLAQRHPHLWTMKAPAPHAQPP